MAPQTMDEDALLELARRGDVPTFNRLTAAYQALVYRQAFCLLTEPRRAEATAQAAYDMAYRGLSSYRGRQAELKLWLLRLVTDLCQASRLGGQAPEPMHPLNVPGGTSGPFKLGDLSDVARHGLLRLPSEQRAALVLVDIQGLDCAEAAWVLRISATTLARRLARGRLRLGHSLKQARIESALPAFE